MKCGFCQSTDRGALEIVERTITVVGGQRMRVIICGACSAILGVLDGG